MALNKIIEELGERAKRTTIYMEDSDVPMEGPGSMSKASIVTITGTYDPPTKRVVLIAVCQDIDTINSPQLPKSTKLSDERKLEDIKETEGPRRSPRKKTPRGNQGPKKVTDNKNPQNPQKQRDPVKPQKPKYSGNPEDPNVHDDPPNTKPNKNKKVFMEDSDAPIEGSDNSTKASIVTLRGTYDPPTKKVELTAVCTDTNTIIPEELNLKIKSIHSPQLPKPTKVSDKRKLEDRKETKGPRRSPREKTPRQNQGPKKENENKNLQNPQEPRDPMNPKKPKNPGNPRDPKDSENPRYPEDHKDKKNPKKNKNNKKKGSEKEEKETENINEETESRQMKEVKSHMILRQRKENKQKEGTADKKKQKKPKSLGKLTAQSSNVKNTKECQQQTKEIVAEINKKLPYVILKPFDSPEVKSQNQKGKIKRRMSLDVKERKEHDRKVRRMSLEPKGLEKPTALKKPSEVRNRKNLKVSFAVLEDVQMSE